MSAKLDPSTGLTCISCRVVFANSEVQRDHYRCDWHRYNLKRKVADLPPITADQFQQKVLSYRDKAAEKEAAASRRSFCVVCNKQFRSINAYDNHLNSKRHKENEAKSRSAVSEKALLANDEYSNAGAVGSLAELIGKQVADLPPITADQFQQKVLSYRDKAAEKEAAASRRSFCVVCNKQFRSINAYDNHLNSKRHKENEAKSRSAVSEKALLANDEYSNAGAVGSLAELIGKQVSATNVLLDHPVPKKPDQQVDNIIDKVDAAVERETEDDGSEGWATVQSSDDEEEEYDESSGIPVTSCLFCLSPSATLEANLAHMSRIHGFFLPDAEFCADVEGMLHYLGLKVGSGNMCLWCNERRRRFRSLDACQKHMRDKAHCRVAHEGDAMLDYDEFYDYSSMYAEGEEESEANDILIEDGYSLILPSGTRVGHRSLMRYYRQHLKPVSEEAGKVKSREATNKLIGQYRAIGWTGTTGALAIQKAKDIRFMRRLNSKQWLKLGIASNKLFRSKGRSDQ
ncbi:Zinc finger protein [Toxocara canis]|uniref:Zinc finger protein n=1 Tax=Toxocara canis TaxID=6265 RepID=A0A0B2UT73_TOXCA|nr:Zinc finger protein [Toxocara canis]